MDGVISTYLFARFTNYIDFKINILRNEVEIMIVETEIVCV